MERPIFVVGCSRSGTTLLQSIIGQHPDLRTFPESNVLPPVAADRMLRTFGHEVPQRHRIKQRVLGRMNRMGWPAGRAKSYRRNMQRFLREVGREDLFDRIPGHLGSMRAIVRNFAAVFDALAEGNRWIEKSPQNVFMLDYITRYLPDARIIHVVREGYANIASLRDAGRQHQEFRGRFGGVDGTRKAVAFWNQALRNSLVYRDAPKHHLLRYEDLCTEPERVMQTACTFLGIDYDAAMLRYSTEGLVLEHEVWKQSDADIRLAPSKFDIVFGDEERALVARTALDADALLPKRYAVSA